jgi:hypothetical protein
VVGLHGNIYYANILEVATKYGQLARIDWCYEYGYTGRDF